MEDMITGQNYRTWRCANYRKETPALGCEAVIQFRALPRPQVDMGRQGLRAYQEPVPCPPPQPVGAGQGSIGILRSLFLCALPDLVETSPSAAAGAWRAAYYVVTKVQPLHRDNCDLLAATRQEADTKEAQAQRTGGKLKRTFSKSKGLYVSILCRVFVPLAHIPGSLATHCFALPAPVMRLHAFTDVPCIPACRRPTRCTSSIRGERRPKWQAHAGDHGSAGDQCVSVHDFSSQDHAGKVQGDDVLQYPYEA